MVGEDSEHSSQPLNPNDQGTSPSLDRSDLNQPFAPPTQPQPAPTVPPTVSPTAPPVAPHPWVGPLTIVFRLLLLGVGVPLAWLAGIAAAEILPSRSQTPPLQEVALRKTNRWITEIAQLPRQTQQSATQETRVEPVPIPVEPIEPLTEAATAELSDTEKQMILDDLGVIATELKTLDARVVDIETRMGRSQSTANLESRLQALEIALSPDQSSASTPTTAPDTSNPVLPNNPASPNPATAIPAPTTPDAPSQNAPAQSNSPQSDPLFQVTDLKITLPSDALFNPGDARLLTNAPTLLNTILSDLSQYPKATILISSHTDDRSDAVPSRELAFQQALALQAYLAQALPSAQYQWVTLGYGQSQPIADNTTPETRQRNRRIEISIDTR
jgi:outer membrane protein OmpA-like peptidoglycan-associated protein